MSVTLTYEGTLSRVKVVGSGIAAGTTGALVERSTDQITWVTVRCGTNAPVVSGVVTVFDYEFNPDVLNYYRVSSAKTVSFLGAGVRAEANNALVTPALPGVHAAGDVLLCYAAIHNSGVGFPNTPAGYTLLLDMSNVRLFGKIDNGAEVAPTVSFTNGVAGPTGAQMAAVRNVDLLLTEFAQQLNGVAANVAYPALDVSKPYSFLLYLGWALKNWTSVNTLSVSTGTAVEIGEPTSFMSSIGQGQVWDYVIEGDTVIDVVAGSFTVVGGPTSISRGAVATLPASLLQETGSITPVITRLWLKSIGSPFLNRSFTCVSNISPIERGERTGLFEVLNRSFPIAVTDLRQSREVTIDVVTQTTQEHVDLDFILARGETMFVQTPATYPLPSMHVVIGRTSERRPLLTRPCNDDWRVFTLPLREVAAPGVDVCGSTITWQGVLNTYATWQAVINGETSWFDLLQNVGSPADVIVP